MRFGVQSIEFTATLFSIALGAGFLGSLTGLGGGVVLTPVLTLLFGVDLRYAIGATLVSVIATSSGAASAYVREGYSNVRIGMLLEVATVAGAIIGASISGYVSTQVLAVIFGVVLLHSAWLSSRRPVWNPRGTPPNPWAERLKLNGCYPTPQGPVQYNVQHVRTGFSVMIGAGILSGLLGIGSGALKVIAMDRAMRIPFKVSTTTSNFMIGVTAAASAGVYLNRGYIDPLLAMPVMLGVLTGSMAGARVLAKASPGILRVVFAVAVAALAVQMIISGLRGEI
jgi:uncharacterized membrane protein YfcA